MQTRKTKLLLYALTCLIFPCLHAVRLQLQPGTKAVIKLGVCPYPRYFQRCSESKDRCLDDLDCPHAELCCTNGCFRMCSVPHQENVVGYVILGAELPHITPPATQPAPMSILKNKNLHKSLSVSKDSWDLLLGYLCGVAEQLHSTSSLKCLKMCSQDSDCLQHTSKLTDNMIKCCNKCCLDPTQLIVQQKSANQMRSLNSSSRIIPHLQYKRQRLDYKRTTSFQDVSTYVTRSVSPIPPPSSSKPGLCPPVLVQSGGFRNGGCGRRCKTDRDCLGPDKCCSNGCGYACQRPISFSLGYGESISSSIISSSKNLVARGNNNFFLTTTSTTPAPFVNTPGPFSGQMVTAATQPHPITVLLGVQPHATTQRTPNSKKCAAPPTSYTECIGISPWRTRYYYHKGLNQCLPIYRCVRNGNNFHNLSSCENTCVERTESLFY